MVASSSNLLLVASTHGHVRTNSTIPNDHDLTSLSTENRGFLIGSSGINSISGTNLKDIIMLETVASTIAFASTSTSASASSSASPPTKKSSGGGEKDRPSRPRPRRKKMVSIGVDAMKKMMVTSSSAVVAIPESPTLVSREREREQRDDMEEIYIRSTSSRKVFSFPMSTPTMPDMMPAIPTPSMNRSSKLKNEISNTMTPMKEKKNHHHLHMGRRLRQIKRRLFLELTSSKTKSSSSKQEEEDGRVSQGTSATTSTTTSTSSFGQTSQEQDEDAPIIDMMTMTTSLKPRVRSMFQEEEEDFMMMPMMPLPAAPWSPSASPSSSTDVVVTTPKSFSTSLNKALSVLSPNGDTQYDDDGEVVADDADDWGIFASFNDDGDDDDDHDIDHKHEYNFKSKVSSRSLVTKSNTPCFQPRTDLPVFAATAGAE